MINLATNLNLNIIAEGVEKIKKYQFLKNITVVLSKAITMLNQYPDILLKTGSMKTI